MASIAKALSAISPASKATVSRRPGTLTVLPEGVVASNMARLLAYRAAACNNSSAPGAG